MVSTAAEDSLVEARAGPWLHGLFLLADTDHGWYAVSTSVDI